MAMLPLNGQHASLVWYHDSAVIKHLVSLNNQVLGDKIKQMVLASYQQKLILSS